MHFTRGGTPDRVAAIRAWANPPDLVSLNLAEDGAIELGSALVDRGRPRASRGDGGAYFDA